MVKEEGVEPEGGVCECLLKQMGEDTHVKALNHPSVSEPGSGMRGAHSVGEKDRCV